MKILTSFVTFLLLVALTAASLLVLSQSTTNTTTSPLATETLYPSYHVRPLTNWINDPNFLMRDPTTKLIHVFCQYNDFQGSTSWGNMSIAHMVSSDYVTWKHLPLALKRGPESYDAGGVFSGSTTFVPSGDGKTTTPVIVYTCVDKDMRQRQCTATLKKSIAEDPLMQEWVKSPGNPVIADPPAGSDFTNFRDPATGFNQKYPANNPSSISSEGEDSTSPFFFIPFAAKINGNATIVNYRFKSDLSAAQFNNILYQPAKTFEAMVECPDFFLDPSIPPSQNMNPKRVILKDSNMEFRQDFYRIGEYNEELIQFAETSPNKIFVDFGMFYASKTFWDPVEKQRVLFGWINEDGYDGGRPGAAIPTNWAGAQSLPRQVIFNKDLGKLATPPLEALKKLRKTQIPSLVSAGTTLAANTPLVVMKAGNAAAGLAHEIQVTLAVPLDKFQSQNGTDLNVGVRFMAESPSNPHDQRSTFAGINIPSGDGSADLNNIDFPGNDILDLPIEVPANATEQEKINFCRELCTLQPSCFAFTYVRKGYPDKNQHPYDYSPRCSMKGRDYDPQAPRPNSPCCVSGRVRQPRVVIDRTYSNTLGSTTQVLTRASGANYNNMRLIELRIFVDHSFVEVYHNEGMEVASTRVYLENAMQNGIQLFSNIDGVQVFSDIGIWPMANIWN